MLYVPPDVIGTAVPAGVAVGTGVGVAELGTLLLMAAAYCAAVPWLEQAWMSS